MPDPETAAQARDNELSRLRAEVAELRGTIESLRILATRTADVLTATMDRVCTRKLCIIDETGELVAYMRAGPSDRGGGSLVLLDRQGKPAMTFGVESDTITALRLYCAGEPRAALLARGHNGMALVQSGPGGDTAAALVPPVAQGVKGKAKEYGGDESLESA